MRGLSLKSRRNFTSQRGIALVTALLATALVLTLLAVMVNVGTARLRTTNEQVRASQALAAADAGVSWVRALLALHHGDLNATLIDLASKHSRLSVTIDTTTHADVSVGLALPGSSTTTDHVDINVQANPEIAETPLQVVATASVTTGTGLAARRTVTTLLRSFHHVSPYSEIVGTIDDAGPASVDSPGDPAGQVGSRFATDLRIQAATEAGSGTPAPANKFQTDRWSDGNAGASGFLP